MLPKLMEVIGSADEVGKDCFSKKHLVPADCIQLSKKVKITEHELKAF